MNTLINKISTIGLYMAGIILFIALSLMVGPAIKFFFRGLLALMNHPLEAFCFFGLLTIFLTAASWVSEK